MSYRGIGLKGLDLDESVSSLLMVITSGNLRVGAHITNNRQVAARVRETLDVDEV